MEDPNQTTEPLSRTTWSGYLLQVTTLVIMVVIVAMSHRHHAHWPRNRVKHMIRYKSKWHAQPVVEGPPSDYGWTPTVTQTSHELIASRYPQLAGLVKSGTLVAWPRPGSYNERRDDGYTEPELLLLIGTAHVSKQSAKDVAYVIESVKPDCVMVELCRSRSAAMAEPAPDMNSHVSSIASQNVSQLQFRPTNHNREADNMKDISQPAAASNGPRQPGPAGVLNLTGSSDGPLGYFSTLQRSAWLGGQSGLVLQILLANLSRKAAGRLGVQGGAEFLAARRAADAVGAQIVLGDRPIEITLQRAWAALGLRQRLRLCWDLIRAAANMNSQNVTEELIERLKRDDALSALLAALSASYPELLGPLIHERDAYLAWSLKRSKAVNGASVVVGVIGAGHMRGVIHALQNDNGGDTLKFSGFEAEEWSPSFVAWKAHFENTARVCSLVAELVGNMNKRETRQKLAVQAAGRFALEVGLGTAAYLAWLQWAS